MTIEVKNITYTYGKGLPHESLAIKNLSVKIDRRSFLGVIGHTGSGKSTFLQHLNGLLKPDSGEIYINETNITDSKTNAVEMRKKTGLVFQYPEYQLFEETVEKDIAFGPKNLGCSEAEIKERVKEAMKLVELPFEEYRNRSPFDLSGGQKRRVAIAGVLAMNPEVLILDEPTAGLDPKTHEGILRMINRVHKDWGGITILVSHNMNDVAQYCDRVIVMDEGEIILEGSPKEIFKEEKKLEEIGLSLPKATQIYNRLVKEKVIEENQNNTGEENGKNEIPVNMMELVKILERNLC